MKRIIELLKTYETILITLKASESDLNYLRELISKLELGNLESDIFDNQIPKRTDKDAYDARRVKGTNKVPKSKIRIENLSDLYKKLRDDQPIDDSDVEVIKSFEVKHPNIRGFLLNDKANLYNIISKVGDRIWSTEELRLILFYHFNIRPNQSTPKTDLLSMLKKNIYNDDYMESMKKNYERG